MRTDRTPKPKKKPAQARRSAGCSASHGSLLKVIERPLLTNGGLYSPPNGVPVILIASDQPHKEKLVTLWHEIVHLMRMAGGYTQDEASVEDAAHRLATACPEALEWVGIHKANKELADR